MVDFGFDDPGPVELDDVAGEKALEEARVEKNWQDESAALVEFEAFEASNALDVEPGTKLLPSRFVDTEEKSRFVAKEIATSATDAFYSPSSTSPTARMVDLTACKLRLPRLVLDVRRAFLNVPETEIVYCRPPWERVNEAGADGALRARQFWRLRKVLYGRRKGTAAFVEWVAQILIKHLAMERCNAAPRLFRRGSTLVEDHVDDLDVAGDEPDLKNFVETLQLHVQVKHWKLLPFGSEGLYSHLRRNRR